MSEPTWPSTRSSRPAPASLETTEPPSPQPGGRPGDGARGQGGLTRATRERRGLDQAGEDGLMHRLLITSPWQRYQLDRDTAAHAAGEDLA